MKIDLPKLPELHGGGYSADALARMLTEYAEAAVKQATGPVVDDPKDMTQARRLITQLRGRVAKLQTEAINLNSTVEVTLSAKGATIINGYYDALYERISAAGQEHKPKPRAEGDTVKDMLWSIMQVFGPHIVMGMSSPFMPNEIRLVERR